MEHFDPLMWVIERAAEDPPVHGAPTLGGRHLLQVRDSVQGRPDCGPTCAGDLAEGCAGAAVGATRGRTGGI